MGACLTQRPTHRATLPSWAPRYHAHDRLGWAGDYLAPDDRAALRASPTPTTCCPGATATPPRPPTTATASPAHNYIATLQAAQAGDASWIDTRAPGTAGKPTMLIEGRLLGLPRAAR